MRVPPRLGKLLYGALFAVGLPALLVLWAAATEERVGLRPLRSIPVGAALAAAGLALMGAGALALRRFGGGLPMNAYPPPEYVTRGIYRVLPHPIYVGFALGVAGISIGAGSASGLWLVTPLVVLGEAALVLGYERLDLARRFPGRLVKAAIHVPDGTDGRPALSDRLSVLFTVLLPWLLLYEAIVFLGAPPDARPAYLGFEYGWRVVEWTEWLYASIYPAVVLAPFVAATRRDLRSFAIRGWTAMAAIFPLFLAIPFVAPPRPFAPSSLAGRLLEFERGLDAAVAAFPSFHVAWAFISAGVFAARWKKGKAVAWIWAFLVSIACVTTGMHALRDVLAGLAVALLAFRIDRVWESVRRLAERAANSWREWDLGGVRVINHGAWAGAGVFLGLLLVGLLTPGAYEGPTLLAAASSLVLAALWAQLIEGSPALLRPYGYYGGLLGVLAGCAAATALGYDGWRLLGGFGVAGPVIQAWGRVRCLVQGCCHGAPAPEWLGIRYAHPRSRVVRLAKLGGVPVHPTPLYSILWNGAIFLTLVRLVSLGAALSLIAGLYLVLNGLGRFVEEAYRGEPQTPVPGGLRLYQWTAIGSVLLGAVLTSFPSPAAAWGSLDGGAVALAAVFGFFTTLALGVDFPRSNRRFARLV